MVGTFDRETLLNRYIVAQIEAKVRFQALTRDFEWDFGAGSVSMEKGISRL